MDTFYTFIFSVTVLFKLVWAPSPFEGAEFLRSSILHTQNDSPPYTPDP